VAHRAKSCKATRPPPAASGRQRRGSSGGARQFAEGELEIGDLQAFRRDRDLAVGGKPGVLEMIAKSQLGVGGGNDENGSLNAKHLNLSGRSCRTPSSDGVQADRANQLQALGIDAISSIPPDFPLTAKQVIIRDALVSGRPYVAKDLQKRLQFFGPPACYLDFEAMMPPIPLYEGTHPYQTLPFQWSLHTRDGDGTLRH
jgi:Domain of unknown function(DUF2779)